MNVPALAARPTPAAELRARATGSPAAGDRFDWSKALALPAYTYGALASGLSAASAYADAHPAGGIVIGPGGIHRNPEWTRHLASHTLLRQVQPILAGVSAGLHLVRGALEVRDGLRDSDSRRLLAGALDLGLAATSALAVVSPGVGGMASLAFMAGRIVVDAHPR